MNMPPAKEPPSPVFDPSDSTSIFTELLVLRAQDGEVDALDQLIRLWQQRWLTFAKRMTGDTDAAQDVLQEACMAMIRGINRLDDPATFRAWSYRIINNKAADYVRKQQRQRRLSKNIAEQKKSQPELNRDDVGSDLIENEQLHRAIEALSDEHRMVIWMHYGDDLSVREIATVLNTRSGTVKSRLHYARELLKRALNDNE